MSVGTIIIAASAAFAFAIAGSALAHNGKAETVTPKFERAIPNIPGKSLVTLEAEYASGAASVPHTCKVRFHLRLCDLGRDRIEGE
jgi:hypothetical protein